MYRRVQGPHGVSIDLFSVKILNRHPFYNSRASPSPFSPWPFPVMRNHLGENVTLDVFLWQVCKQSIVTSKGGFYTKHSIFLANKVFFNQSEPSTLCGCTDPTLPCRSQIDYLSVTPLHLFPSPRGTVWIYDPSPEVTSGVSWRLLSEACHVCSPFTPPGGSSENPVSIDLTPGGGEWGVRVEMESEGLGRIWRV